MYLYVVLPYTWVTSREAHGLNTGAGGSFTVNPWAVFEYSTRNIHDLSYTLLRIEDSSGLSVLAVHLTKEGVLYAPRVLRFAHLELKIYS